ncbi:MAG: DUF3298 and DUF4163 domain-containing protein [Bacteroidetes bacterium]|nr:DUF3298 and DUF4163 domain-containing protein [Bacteroidota bacterium]MBU1579243.1 DUF3298 and DUF4163 domain-containing protein [Bacteroidota bacterium]MBU2557312.1 DUF3298 and DUF4163 domain-containing protein [Bacteroidota bacterium]
MLIKPIFFFLIIFSLAAQNAFAQTDFVSSFSGSIGQNTATMHLVQVKGKLRAHLFYAPNGQAAYLTLSGSLKQNGNFFLQEEMTSDTLIRGRMTANRMEGYLINTQNQLERIALVATNLKGSIPLKPYSYSADHKLNTALPGGPHALFESELLLPEASTSNPLSDSILKLVFDVDTTVSPLQILEREATNFFDNYQKLNTFENTDTPSFQWVKTCETGVLINEGGFLCIESNTYGYTGGAHGLPNRLFTVLDTETGEQLHITDLFTENAENSLFLLLNDAIRKRYEIPADSSLKSFGFFFDQIEPNTNYWLGSGGIGFYYNSYEIAPYSFGHTNIYIPFESIEALMKEAVKQKLSQTQTFSN